MLTAIDGGKAEEAGPKIEIDYDFINTSNIMGSMKKVANAPGYSQGVLIRMSGVIEKFTRGVSLAQMEFQAILEECGERDEKGQFKAAPNGDPVVKPEKKEEYEARLDAWKKQKIVIKKAPFDLHELAPAELTPNDLIALKPFIKSKYHG
jgi:hypothetical protein